LENWEKLNETFRELVLRGWRAAERGKQTISLFFDERQRMRRICLRFIELEGERTQQFTLQWSKDKSDALRPLFQQQWNLSPSGSTSQIGDYEVDLDGVWMLQLVRVFLCHIAQSSRLASSEGVSCKLSRPKT
jgi:hypothetical protein